MMYNKMRWLLLLALFPLTTVFAQAKKQPNILVVVFDDLRPEIGSYGAKEAITPNIDAIAKEGVRFNRAYVNYPLCNPSRASFLTGIRFDNQKVEAGKKVDFNDLIDIQPSLPEVLKSNGYWNATRGKIYHGNVPKSENAAWNIPGPFWSSRGFQDWSPEIVNAISEKGGRTDQMNQYLKTGKGSDALIYVALDASDEVLEDGKTAKDVVGYLRDKRNKEQPFFICAGFSRPHMPWVAPKKYFDMYPPDAGTLAPMPKGEKAVLSKEDKNTENGLWNEGVADTTAERLIRGYMAATTFADAQLGKIIQALKDENLYENTIIVIWGDHGYHLTDHGLWRKNTSYHVALRCPLIIKAPGVQKGSVNNNVVANIDVYPTLLDLAGIKPPSDVKLAGKSLKPLLMGQDKSWINEAYTCAKGDYSLITDQYRFTVGRNGKQYLYDLKSDPGEWKNLAGMKTYSELIKDYEAKIKNIKWNGK